MKTVEKLGGEWRRRGKNEKRGGWTLDTLDGRRWVLKWLEEGRRAGWGEGV